MPLIPLLGVTANLYLMVNLSPFTWIRFVIWLACGVVLYAAYGARHSRLGLAAAHHSPTTPQDEHHLLADHDDHDHSAFDRFVWGSCWRWRWHGSV